MAEAVVSLIWTLNDKSWYAQGVRMSRILAGVFIMVVVR